MTAPSLLISHDRDFLDRVASTTIAMEGQRAAPLSMPAAGATIARSGAEGDASEATARRNRAAPKHNGQTGSLRRKPNLV